MKNDTAVTYQEYISINIGPPTQLIDNNSKESYIAYEIAIKTNSLSFSAPHTRVYRRYRDFVWLQRRLKSIPNEVVPVPPLPRRQILFWDLDKSFLEKRRHLLELYLQRVVRETIFLSSSSLHLFLQTDLPPAEMEFLIKSGSADTAMEKHVNLAKVDDELTNSFQSSSESLPNMPRNKDDEEISTKDRRTSIEWRCKRSTMLRVASLPHFSPVLKNFDNFTTDEDISKTNPVINSNSNASNVAFVKAE